jgi:hypothetical protein
MMASGRAGPPFQPPSGGPAPIDDYDMEAFNKSGMPHTPGGHYPDTFKRPNHITFSDESMYSGKPGGPVGGHWGDHEFTPSADNLRNTPRSKMEAYFKEHEPGYRVTPERNLFTTPTPKDPKQADALWGERQRYVEQQQKGQYQPEGGKSDIAISPPPRLPPNADKGQISQFKAEHQAWTDDLKFNSLHKAMVEGGHSNAKQRLEIAAIKTQHDVAQKDLEDATSKFERSKGMFSSGDPKLKGAVDRAQSTLDSVKAKRDKLMDDILSDPDKGSTKNENAGTKEDPIMLKSEDEATDDMIGKIVSVDGKLHRVEADE